MAFLSSLASIFNSGLYYQAALLGCRKRLILGFGT